MCLFHYTPVTGLQADVARLTGELEAAKEALKEEQLKLGDANVQSDTLRRESMNLDTEGRKLRQSWEEKVYNLKKAEEDRDHFKVPKCHHCCSHSTLVWYEFRLNSISLQSSMQSWWTIFPSVSWIIR